MLMSMYTYSMAQGFQLLLQGFFYDMLDIFNIASMQLQLSCWKGIASNFFECKNMELDAMTADLEAVVPARVFMAGLMPVSLSPSTFEAHEDSYIFDACPVWGLSGKCYVKVLTCVNALNWSRVGSISRCSTMTGMMVVDF